MNIPARKQIQGGDRVCLSGRGHSQPQLTLPPPAAGGLPPEPIRLDHPLLLMLANPAQGTRTLPVLEAPSSFTAMPAPASGEDLKNPGGGAHPLPRHST